MALTDARRNFLEILTGAFVSQRLDYVGTGRPQAEKYFLRGDSQRVLSSQLFEGGV
jgi:hypothetical protein